MSILLTLDSQSIGHFLNMKFLCKHSGSVFLKRRTFIFPTQHKKLVDFDTESNIFTSI